MQATARAAILLALMTLLPASASAIPDEATREVGPCSATYDVRAPFYSEGVSCLGVELVGVESTYGWGAWCQVRVAGTPVFTCVVP